MWKVGDECWILNKRGVIRKATVVDVEKSRTTGHVYPRRVRTVGGVYCNVWMCDRTPEPFIKWIREKVVREVGWYESGLERAKERRDSVEADIQAMLDEAGGWQ